MIKITTTTTVRELTPEAKADYLARTDSYRIQEYFVMHFGKVKVEFYSSNKWHGVVSGTGLSQQWHAKSALHFEFQKYVGKVSDIPKTILKKIDTKIDFILFSELGGLPYAVITDCSCLLPDA